MQLLKLKDRTLQVKKMLACYRGMGADTRVVGRFLKWKDIGNGRLSMQISVYEMSIGGQRVYILEDSLGYLCSDFQTDREGVFRWIQEHGFKTEHDFYTQDGGMTEEAWAAWNA